MSQLLKLFDENPLTHAIRQLFASGEQGIWLDPSDFSTLFQDAAGTTPVTAVGQPVGKILDKSGRGNHATQSTAASRPTLQQDSNGMYYLSFDGVDDGMATPSINFTGTDKMTVWAGVRKLSDVYSAVICELSANYASNNGAFIVQGPSGSAANYVAAHRGASANPFISATPYAAPVTNVLTVSSALSSPSIRLRVNAGAFSENTSATGGGNYGNYPLYIGRRGGTSLPFNGRIYQLIVRGAESNAGQIAAGEAWVNSKTRAY